MADLKDVKRIELARDDLYKRMDADKNLAALSPYALTDKQGKPVSGMINITLNLPALFSAHVKAALLRAVEDVVASGIGRDDDVNSPVEKFVRAGWRAADMRLAARDESLTSPFLADQVDLRGRGAFRVTWHKKDRVVIPDILPIDTRHFTYEMGSEGLLWGAYKTKRSGRELLDEYPQAAQKARVKETDKEIPFVDLWDGDQNVRYANGKEIQADKNQHGYPPFVVRHVPMGLLTRDDDAMVREGESIFYLIRTLVPELNRLATIMQTQNMSGVKPAREYASKEGVDAEPAEEADVMGTTTPIDIGGGYGLLDMPDITNSGRLMHQVLTRLIQAGSLSMTDYGNLTFPLSAVALIELGESQSEVFAPRLGTFGLIKQAASEMFIEQAQRLGVSQIELGTRGHKQKFKVSKLEGDYDLDFTYDPTDPATDIARMNFADVARAWLDDDTIVRTILKMKDPAEIKRKRLNEEVERLSPVIKLYRHAQALLKEGRTLEAKILADQLDITMDQLASGNLTPEEEKGRPTQPARNMLQPVEGTRAGSNQRAEQLSSAGVREGVPGSGA